MQLSKSAAKRVNDCGWLAKALAEYFAIGEFVFDSRHLVAAKWRGDGCYVVLCFRVGSQLWITDIAGTDGLYSVCNDGEETTEEQWKRLRVDRYCDTYHIEGED